MDVPLKMAVPAGSTDNSQGYWGLTQSDIPWLLHLHAGQICPALDPGKRYRGCLRWGTYYEQSSWQTVQFCGSVAGGLKRARVASTLWWYVCFPIYPKIHAAFLQNPKIHYPAIVAVPRANSSKESTPQVRAANFKESEKLKLDCTLGSFIQPALSHLPHLISTAVKQQQKSRKNIWNSSYHEMAWHAWQPSSLAPLLVPSGIFTNVSRWRRRRTPKRQTLEQN